ncbi:MAG: hypothetical protein DMF63_02395 [Acidobacteria bacterium]|nr:MAG: hypothetical protein DMF63_02395 [Acidobacteriota bacterium]
MGEKRCGKCGEITDEAKAFCPGCGRAFVDEKQRTDVSDFDRSANTVQLGETMFNEMLSDMGLSVSKGKHRTEKDIDTVIPSKAERAAASPQEQNIEPPTPSSASGRMPILIWIAIIVLALIAVAMLVVIAVMAATIWK